MSSKNADNLLLFKSIIDTGSLSNAAKAIDISISQASKRMAQLEKTLGLKLLQRSTRQLSLTPPGEMLYQKLANIKAQIDDAWQSMLDYGNAPRGKLHITAPWYYGLNHLVAFVHQFNQHHPDIHVELEFTNNENAKHHATQDICFKSQIAVSNQSLPNWDLTAKKVATEKLVYVASKQYLEQSGTPEQPEALQTHQCLGISSKKCWTFYDGKHEIQLPVAHRLKTNSFEALLQAATAGMGIAQIPESLLKKSSELTELFKNYESERLETYACYNANHFSIKKVNLFIKSLVKLH